MENFLRMEFKESCMLPGSSGKFRIIRYSKQAHHDVIPLIYADSFKEKPWGADWDNIDEFDPEGIFLAEAAASNELAGFVVSFKRKYFGYISVVAVSSGWQRRGAAEALIRAAVEYLHFLGLETVRIDVEEKNAPAIDLYKKIGFYPAGT